MRHPAKSAFGKYVLHSFSTRNFHVGIYSVLATIGVIAIAVIINLLAAKLPSTMTQLDCTANQLYSVSQETKLMTEDLSQDVTIYLLAQSDNIDSTLEALLDRYRALSDHIQTDVIDPVANPTFAEQYTDETIRENSLLVVSGNKSQYIDYYDIYATNYDSYYSTGSVTYDFDGEGLITSAINYVTSDNLTKVYMLTGHGESSLSTDFSTAVSRQNIEIAELNLLTEESVPEDCQCLMILGPTSDISTEELKKIQSYLSSGGNLMLLTDETEEQTENLSTLMASYGVASEPGLVLEGDSNYSVYGYNYYLLPEIMSHTITSPLSSSGYYVLVPFAQGLYETGTQPDSVSITPLLATSEQAYIKSEGMDMQTTSQEDGDKTGQYYLGLAITNQIDDDTQSQIVWFSSSMLLDDGANEMVAGGNQDLFLNSLKWMCGETDAITIHTKSLSSELLTVTAADANRWALILVILLPVAFLSTSFAITIRRKRR